MYCAQKVTMINNIKKVGIDLERHPDSKISEFILNDMLLGKIMPGTRLDEVKLAKRFKVSRTPVRQALHKLVAKNMLLEKPRKGIFVPSYDNVELSQMYEAMHEMEVMCATLASLRLTLFSRMKIKKKQAECKIAAEKGDIVLFLKINESFHEAIYTSTQNPFLAELTLSFRQRTQVSRSQKYKSKKDLLKTISEHDTLVNYIFGNKDQVTEKELFTTLSQPIIETLSLSSS